MDYVEYSFKCRPVQPTSDILMSLLAEHGFESFVNTEIGIDAFVPFGEDNEARVEETLLHMEGEVSFQRRLIKDQNWNAQWESDYEPVCVGDSFRVRAPFHESEEGFKHEIIIQPQMSFGTGHHGTTWLMLDELSKLPLQGKSILDAGSGTGVLAIAAMKSGASRALAYDIEDWAFENTLQNVTLNDVEVEVLKGDVSIVKESGFGVILANINKNVLLEDLPQFASLLSHSGKLLLSGFFTTDVQELSEKAEKHGLKVIATNSKEEWAQLTLEKL